MKRLNGCAFNPQSSDRPAIQFGRIGSVIASSEAAAVQAAARRWPDVADWTRPKAGFSIRPLRAAEKGAE